MSASTSTELRHLAEALNVASVEKTESIQTLWSGYGELYRIRASSGPQDSLIVKSVHLPKETTHPRGWSGEIGHKRKIRSYQVESSWYRDFAPRFVRFCPMPTAFHLESTEHGFLLVLSDLDAAGYSARPTSLENRDLTPYLDWLATFHALGLTSNIEGLWNPGSYWHLATRPEELEAISDNRLRHYAPAIDRELRQARFQTIIHGDAKLANFCVNARDAQVAMVDYQYTGRGCGVQDVAYFLSSALSPDNCAMREAEALSIYFTALEAAIMRHQPTLNATEVVEEWQRLYCWAWADFVRFLAGWAPHHYKIDRYSLQLTEDVLRLLEKREKQL